MSPSYSPERNSRGFTLIEVTVAMTVLVIVLLLSGTLLFSLKSFAQRQQAFADPRQSARRAIEYLSYSIRGATDQDMVVSTNLSPNALVMYYSQGTSTKQASFDNVTDATIANLGTDIITVGLPSPGSQSVTIYDWVGDATGATFKANYQCGCSSDSANLASLQSLLGYNSGTTRSNLFTIYDPAGAWQYYDVKAGGYVSSTCANAGSNPAKVVSLQCATGGASGDNPPGGYKALSCSNASPCFMSAGVRFVTYRVRTSNGVPRLEQSSDATRIFDAAVDNPGASFTPLLDNIVDLQIAYVFDDGTVWNTSQARLDSTNYPGYVPAQDATPSKARDVTNVTGLRLTVVARSSSPFGVAIGRAGKVAPVTPPENSTVVYSNTFYHYRLTSLVMLRNRTLGG